MSDLICQRKVFFSDETGLEEIAISYFYAEFTCTEILEFLTVQYGHPISLYTLKRRFKTLDLHRRLLIPWRVNSAA